MLTKDLSLLEKETYNKLKGFLNLKQQKTLKEILKIPRLNKMLLIATNKPWPTYVYHSLKHIVELKNDTIKNDAIREKFKYMEDFEELKNIKKVKFKKIDIHRAIGVELTYNTNDNNRSLIHYYNVHKIFPKKSHFDSSCLEIPSEILKTKKALLENYNKYTTFSKNIDYHPYVKNIAGGGCHFNIDLTNEKFKYKFLKNIYTDFKQRPYLNWIFNDSYDNITANKIPRWVNCHIKRGLYPRTKNYGLSYRNNRIEFRGFQMARNIKEFEKQLDFINEYTEMASKGLLKHINGSPIEKFKHLLLQLNLNYKDYYLFINRNYKNRLRYGKDYLK